MNPFRTTFAVVLSAVLAAQAGAAPPLSQQEARSALAATVSRLIEDAIPRDYEKKKDWGATTNVAVGVRISGKPFHLHANKRERAVNHGVWKHYKLHMIEPAKNLVVRLERLETLPSGGSGFTLVVDAKLDAWARAKAYHYGVHLIALEAEGDMQVRLRIEGALTLQVQPAGAETTFALVPVVTSASLEFNEFHLRRVSNAHGPIVRELGDGLPALVEEEVNGPRLAEKLNRAIEKKRDRLTFRPAELWSTSWWPLAPAQ